MQHDTMAVFQIFYYFYNELFFHGQLAQWAPYGTFGLDANFLQLSLSPLSYLAILSGWLLKIEDVLLLFKVSLIAEQMLFLTGMYLLSRFLFSKRSTIFLICLGGIGSSVLYYQIYFNFRIYYLFPLITYFIFFALHKTDARSLWFASIIGLAWLLGNSPYFICLWGLVFSIMFTSYTFLTKKNGLWPAILKPNLKNLSLFCIAGLIFTIYLYFLKHASDFTVINTPLRDLVSGRNNLLTFLIYGSKAKLDMLIQCFIFGWPAHLPLGQGVDNSVYIGLLPLLFFVWAVIRVRNRIFLSILIAAFALVWLSFGGLFTVLVYFFPGMAYYRHIGLVWGLAKIMFLICAGFGLDDFWTVSLKKKISLLFFIVLIFVFILDIQPQALKQWLQPIFANMNTEEFLKAIPHILKYTLNPFMHPDVLTVQLDKVNLGLLLRLGVYVGVAAFMFFLSVCFYRYMRSRNRKVPAPTWETFIITALIISFSIDLMLYQFLVFKGLPKLPKEQYNLLYSTRTRELKFQAQRQMQPESVLEQRALALISGPWQMTSYAYAYNFVQFDPCVSNFWPYLLPSGVAELSKTIKPDNQHFLDLIGCNKPKIRLFDNEAFLAGNSDMFIKEASITVNKFSANEVVIDADNPEENGAWLVYADAFHPGWQAVINGKKKPVIEAHQAFKAVLLEKGKSTVKFVFYYGLSYAASIFIALFGLITGVVFLVLFLQTLFSRYENRKNLTA